MNSALGLPDQVTETASQLFRNAQSRGMLPGRSIEAMSTASLHIASRLCETPRSLDEVTHVSREERQAIARAHRYIVNELEIPLEPTSPIEHLPRFASDIDASQSLENVAEAVLEIAIDNAYHSGKSPAGLAAAALYIGGKIADVMCPTQGEIAEVANVTEVTIRNRYQEMLQLADDKKAIRDRANLDQIESTDPQTTTGSPSASASDSISDSTSPASKLSRTPSSPSSTTHDGPQSKTASDPPSVDETSESNPPNPSDNLNEPASSDPSQEPSTKAEEEEKEEETEPADDQTASSESSKPSESDNDPASAASRGEQEDGENLLNDSPSAVSRYEQALHGGNRTPSLSEIYTPTTRGDPHCPYCARDAESFGNHHGVDIHIGIVHPMEDRLESADSVVSPSDDRRCPYCPDTIQSDIEDLNGHIKASHPDHPTIPDSTSESEDAEIPETTPCRNYIIRTEGGGFTCPVCSRTAFIHRAACNAHIISEHPSALRIITPSLIDDCEAAPFNVSHGECPYCPASDLSGKVGVYIHIDHQHTYYPDLEELKRLITGSVDGGSGATSQPGATSD